MEKDNSARNFDNVIQSNDSLSKQDDETDDKITISEVEDSDHTGSTIRGLVDLSDHFSNANTLTDVVKQLAVALDDTMIEDYESMDDTFDVEDNASLDIEDTGAPMYEAQETPVLNSEKKISYFAEDVTVKTSDGHVIISSSTTDEISAFDRECKIEEIVDNSTVQDPNIMRKTDGTHNEDFKKPSAPPAEQIDQDLPSSTTQQPITSPVDETAKEASEGSTSDKNKKKSSLNQFFRKMFKKKTLSLDRY